LSDKLDCQPKQLQEKIDKLLKEFSHMKEDHELLQAQIVKSHLAQLCVEKNKSVD